MRHFEEFWSNISPFVKTRTLSLELTPQNFDKILQKDILIIKIQIDILTIKEFAF